MTIMGRAALGLCLAVLPGLALQSGSAVAADPQPYTVVIAPTGVAALDEVLADSATLATLREVAPAGPFALVARARGDEPRLQQAAASFGYYAARLRLRVAGRTVDDPALPAVLDGTAGSVAVTIAVDPGPLYQLRRITLRNIGGDHIPDAAGQALGIARGDPAVAINVLAATDRMLLALQKQGFALAKVSAPQAFQFDDARAIDVAYEIDAGPRVVIGPVTVLGLQQVDPEFVRRRVRVEANERYDPDRIEAARQDLAAIGVFATVRVRAAERLGLDGRLPVAFDVTERKRHAVGVTAAYSTDLGGSVGATFQHRNLFGAAERLDLGAAITQIGGSASKGIGYNATAALTKPDVWRRDQAVTVSAQAVRESLQAYDRTAVLAGGVLSRKIGTSWVVGAGVQAQQSRITQEKTMRDYTLVGLPLTVRYDGIGPAALLEPVQGIKAQVSVTPTADLGQRGGQFTILQAGGSAYADLAAPGQTVVAVRVLGARVVGATTLQLPPDQRLYAGGGGTVRGYRYQSIGPQFASRRPIGGTSLLAGTVEIRQRIGDFGVAAFVDAGRVGGGTSQGGGVKAGAGLGVRYYTAIGPIRVDVAVPLNKQRGDDAFEFYVGIGQAF